MEDRDIASFVEEANAKIEKEVTIPDGYYIKWAGDFKNMQGSHSYPSHDHTDHTAFDPVCFSIQPLTLSRKHFLYYWVSLLEMIGGIVGLLISGEYLSVSAIVGFIAIFAIAILNGIVLVSFIDELRKKFPTVKTVDLVKDATLLRLRPVLMTAFTTLFGILPLLYATGVGSEIQYPLSVVVTGGIISSTILTLLVLPGLYVLFFGKEK